jgi:hypothetical protein
MTSYVQLGRGFRPNYEVGSLRHHSRRRPGAGGLMVVLALAGVVFGAGLLFGRLNGAGAAQTPATSAQPMQFYPR